MENQPPLQLAAFQSVIEKRVVIFQIIAGVLFLGVTLFLGIVLFLYSQNSGVEDSYQTSELGILSLLSTIHIGVACICYIVAYFVYCSFTSLKGLAKRIASPPPNMNPVEMTPELCASGSIFTAYLMRAALLEGPAMFGVIVCLLGVLNGEIRTEPIYWFNLFSYCIFGVVTLWTFPTRERLETIFQRRFMEQGPIF